MNKIVNGIIVKMSSDDESNFLKSQEALVPTLQVLIGNFIIKIDLDADALIRAVIGERASQYEGAEREALSYKAANYTGNIPSKVQAWATAKNQTAQWAADSQVEMAVLWRNAENELYAKRLILKEAARNSTDVTELDTVKSGWNEFVVSFTAKDL
jgi:hypothetical protein